MKIYQSRIFENKVKKLSKQEKELLDAEIKKIAENPTIGEEKKGDLRGIFVYKFKIKSLQYLLSYRMLKSALELIMLGPHENYYRDLKDYLKRK
ncbi:MAG TPA: type II toxin-antitoxin system RelE/ParE family toxin [Dissulfurispiraceae bacterium]|nr:type II toxin-antitoxin system RelE/ParE family toxin [Dissulfurispiraceae bacterium]